MLHKNCAKKISLICVIVRVLRSEMVPQQLQDRFTLRSRHNWQALEIGPRTYLRIPQRAPTRARQRKPHNAMPGLVILRLAVAGLESGAAEVIN
jgi:hypothetical protein